MSNVTAVILSASRQRAQRRLAGVRVLPHVSSFRNAAGLLDARLEALKRVETDWFFFLDDDDELPADYLHVLERCQAAGTPIAYTDELITNDDGTDTVRRGAPYSEDGFIANSTLIHHLALCRTADARRAADMIPRGSYAVENLLYFEIAKGGATYVPEIGYVWHRRKSGLNRHPSVVIGLVRSTCWAQRNRSESRG